MEEKSDKKKGSKSFINILLVIFMILIVAWFLLTLYEFNRVKNDKKPLICLNEIKDIESNAEYSKTCYGILYKYREYYFSGLDKISAREFTLIFKDFQRKVMDNEIK